MHNHWGCRSLAVQLAAATMLRSLATGRVLRLMRKEFRCIHRQMHGPASGPHLVGRAGAVPVPPCRCTVWLLLAFILMPWALYLVWRLNHMRERQGKSLGEGVDLRRAWGLPHQCAGGSASWRRAGSGGVGGGGACWDAAGVLAASKQFENPVWQFVRRPAFQFSLVVRS
jgi:hypothetical protein